MRCLAGHTSRLAAQHASHHRAAEIMGKRSTTTPTATSGAKKKPKPSASDAASTPGSNSQRTAPSAPDIEDCNFPPEQLPQLRSALLSWYDANHRILPWRRNPHSQLPAEVVAAAAAAGQHPAPFDLPQDTFIYRVWVCEIMSQQTQVSRAAEYFRRWVDKWPDVRALAAATQEEVNELWAGLGYYRRARFLLDGAKYIANDLSGAFPRTASELQKIPGVGAYTSAAIASIACGERSAVVDGNVVRVLARLRRLGGDPKTAAMTKLFAELAAAALDPDRPGDFNQAMMELGATVCVPNTHPDCAACPLSAWCEALKEEKEHGQGAGGDRKGASSVTDYPSKSEKAEKREEAVAVAVVALLPPEADAKSAGKFLLVQRPQGGLLAGLWEFPLQPIEAAAGKDEARSAIDKYLSELLQVQVQPGEGAAAAAAQGRPVLRVVERKQLGEVVHVFSHIRMTMKVESLVLQGKLPPLPSTAPAAAAAVAAEEGDDATAAAAATTSQASPKKSAGKGGKKGKAAAGGEVAPAAAQTQWLTGEEIGAKGLSSGVKKVFKLYSQERHKGRTAGSIQRFFKPAGGSG